LAPKIWDTANVGIAVQRKVGGAALLAVALVVAGCSGDREVGPVGRPASPGTETSPPPTGEGTIAGTSPGSTASGGTATTAAPGSSVAGTTTTTTAATNVLAGTAVAGSAGGVETGGPPFPNAYPFTEAIRLSDGSCVGWAGSAGGSTLGLAVGSPVVVLAAETDRELGRGRVRRSRWENLSRSGRQWNCFFDFTATLNRPPPAEVRIRIGPLQPWLAGPDPNDPDVYVASVSTGALIELIPSCPPVPDETATTTTVRRRRVRQVSGWHAIGQYWSRGVASLCRAGLPVTAIARPCRPRGVGSEYISEVVDSHDSTVHYRDGQKVPVGTQVTVVVATGRPC
jgi:hypothetical protein